MTSIKDVAKKAGVGIATVSRVVNDSGYVKKETREKVEKVIAELEYQPNEIARSLLKKKNGVVAFIVPNTKHLFFGELVHHVEQELFDYGYKLLICNSSEKIDKELAYLDMLNQNRVDAVIFLTNNDIEKYLKKNLPLITFDRKFDGIPYVASDNYAGGVMAADHFMKVGCKKFMFLGDDAQGENTPVITDVSLRRIGFIDRLKANGFNDILTIEYPLGDYIRIPENVFDRVLEHEDVDAIFCISDAVAAEVVLHLEAAGRKVPEEIKVIGYDGGRSFINLGKKMTSIGQDPALIAKSIVKIINAYYEKEKIENEIVPVYFSEGETA